MSHVLSCSEDVAISNLNNFFQKKSTAHHIIIFSQSKGTGSLREIENKKLLLELLF